MTSAIVGKVPNQFREKFLMKNKDVLRWFPGHMDKGMKQMQQKLRSVDCIIEVHDARVPISGRYADFKNTLLGIKPHIFVLNKSDLADKRYLEPAMEQLRREGHKHILYTNFKNDRDKQMKEILPLAKKIISESDRFQRTEEKDFEMMIIGVPNVGKSSLINRLRNVHLKRGNATKVGAEAGITRSVLNRIKISENPTFFLLDTPGILPPNIPDIYSGLKLALVGCYLDHLVGPIILADYLLYWLNKNQNFSYVTSMMLPEPIDKIEEVLTLCAVGLKRVKKLKNFDGQYVYKPDLHIAAEHFIRLFRNGDFGPCCLDDDILSI